MQRSEFEKLKFSLQEKWRIINEIYFLPEFTCHIISHDYLNHFFADKPKILTVLNTDIKFGNILGHIPHKSQMFPLFKELAAEMNVSLGFTEEFPPDSKWMATVLKSLKKEKYEALFEKKQDEISSTYFSEQIPINSK